MRKRYTCQSTAWRTRCEGQHLRGSSSRRGEKLNCGVAARVASTPSPGAPRLGRPFRDILGGSKVLTFVPTQTSHWFPEEVMQTGTWQVPWLRVIKWEAAWGWGWGTSAWVLRGFRWAPQPSQQELFPPLDFPPGDLVCWLLGLAWSDLPRQRRISVCP